MSHGDIAGTPTLSDDHLIDIETGNGHYESIKIIAGFIGYSQHQLNYSLSPIIGWFVVSNDGNNNGYRHNMNNNGYDHRLAGISEDEDDVEDNYDVNDDLALMNKGSNHQHIKIAQDDGDDEDEDELNYVQVQSNKKRRNSKQFMAVDVEDEDDGDDVQKELHAHTK